MQAAGEATARKRRAAVKWGTRFRRAIFEDTCLWLSGALGRAESPDARQALADRAWALLKEVRFKPNYNRGAGAYRAWLVQFLCDTVYAGHEAPEIDVYDPPIEEMARDRRVSPAGYRFYLALCRRTESVVLHPDVQSVVDVVRSAKDTQHHASSEGEEREGASPSAEMAQSLEPMVDAYSGDTKATEGETAQSTLLDQLARRRSATLHRIEVLDEVIGECQAAVSRCSAALDKEHASAVEVKNKLVAVSLELKHAIQASAEATAEVQHTQAVLRGEEMGMAECVYCGRLRELGAMRRLTLCCGHLCCLDCFRSSLIAALRIAVDSDAPLLCPGCVAHRPSAPGVRVDEAVAEAVPPEAHAMVDPLALVLVGTAGSGEAGTSEGREEWEREVVERVAEQQVTFGDFVVAKAEGEGGQRARLSRCPRCPAFSAHGLSCYATGAARCTNPRCAQLYCSRCGAFPFHFGLPCPSTAGTPEQLQSRATALLKRMPIKPAYDTGAGVYRAWLTRLLCDKALVEAEEVWPAMYERFLAQCRRTGRIVEFPDIDTIVRTAPPAPGRRRRPPRSNGESVESVEAPVVSPLSEVSQQDRRAALERAGIYGLMIAEYKAELVRYAAVLERETAFVEEIRSHMATVTVELSNATSAHSEALAEAQHSDSAPPGTETEQRMLGAECVLCGDLHELGRTRRLTLCCGHLCCLDCLRSTIPAALSCAVDSDVPLLCPGCAAHRPPAQDSMRRLTLCCGHLCCLDCLRSTLPAALCCAVDSDVPLLCPGCAAHRPPAPVVRVDAAVAEAVPQEAHAMVDPLALAITGTGDTAEAVEEEEWLREVAERVARQQVTFGDFVATEAAGGQRARLSRCPRCPAFSAHGLSCYATGAARCTNPRCAQLYCSRCGAFPFHFGNPCPASSS
eukprot:m51a1_g7852 hypothetical protein (909) ;mRNA; f:233928-237542